MDKKVKEKVANLLEEASKLLLADSPNTSATVPSCGGDSSHSTRSGTTTGGTPSCSTLGETLQRAQGMLRESSSSGLYRRLNRNERLRAASPYQQSKQTSAKPPKEKAKKEKKAIEFALLKCWEDDEEEPHHLKWDSVIASGMLMLHDNDNEKTIRNALKESLAAKIPSLGAKIPSLGDNDFDFVKVRHKTITMLELGPGTEFNYAVVKKMAGQGLLYVKVKQGYEFLYDQDNDSDAILLKSYMDQEIQIVSETKPAEACSSLVPPDKTALSAGKKDQLELNNHQESSVHADDALVNEIRSQEMSDPVEILRFLQKNIIEGRELDVGNTSDTPEGETNYICVNRHDILTSTFSELEAIQNFHVTFEVDFIGEMGRDLGGPRKEWIRLMNAAMKEKYFDRGVREYLADDYYYVGIMMGIALLQNGQLPAFIPADVIDNLVSSPTGNPCIANLQRGLNVFGLARIMQKIPILLYLLRPNNVKLAAKMVLKLLAPTFSEEGSTAYLKEKEFYALFVKYVRQVASGRREPITLSSLLIFVTGAAEEPVLGFTIHPSITFLCEDENSVESAESPEPNMYKFLPTAHTCSNNMVLPIGSLTSKLPKEDRLFEIYDCAFGNSYFGTI